MGLVFAFFSVVIGCIYLLYRFGKNGLGNGLVPLIIIGSIIVGPIIVACIFGSTDNIAMNLIGFVLANGCIFAVMFFYIRRGKKDEEIAKRAQQVHEYVKKLDPSKEELDVYRRKLVEKTGNRYLDVWDRSVVDAWYQDQFNAKYQEMFGEPYKPLL